MIRTLLISLLALTSGYAMADVEVGKPAPDFTTVDTNGKTESLKDYQGKIVVLEWLNFNCPFVKKHYGAGNMQKLQANATKDGVVWLSVASSGKSKKDYRSPKELNDLRAEKGGKQTAILMDADGKIGKAYGAKNTPEMFVIDAKGNIAYRGAIDSIDSAEAEDIAKARNYVAAAISDLKANRKVATSDTKPYGCGVKYEN